MSEQQILEGIRRIMRHKLRVRGTIEPHMDLFYDLQLDSLKHLTLVVELENYFRVCFEPGDEAGVTTVEDIVELVGRLTAQKGSVHA